MPEPDPKPAAGSAPNVIPAWLRWVGWAMWGLLEVILLQGAWASRQEHEPRAALLFAMLFGVLLLGAGILRFIQRARLLE